MDSALLLHGGPGLSDYTAELAAELEGRWRPIRYQQRGLAPAPLEGPFSVETHVADAVAVLDRHGVERAWLVGHSWGGHLALHVGVAQAERVLGAVIVDPLGAVPDGGAAELDENLMSRLDPHAAAEARRIDEAALRGEPDADAVEMLRLVWPFYFASPDTAPSMPDLRLSVAAYAETWGSVQAHFERGTLVDGLPHLRFPVLFVHGRLSPIPPYRSAESAALIPGARVELIDDAGHFPWLDQPGSVRDAVERWLGTTRQGEAAPGTLASQGEA